MLRTVDTTSGIILWQLLEFNTRRAPWQPMESRPHAVAAGSRVKRSCVIFRYPVAKVLGTGPIVPECVMSVRCMTAADRFVSGTILRPHRFRWPGRRRYRLRSEMGSCLSLLCPLATPAVCSDWPSTSCVVRSACRRCSAWATYAPLPCKVFYQQLAFLFILFSRSIGSLEMGVGQMELAAGVGWETEAQAGLILKSDLDVELDLMRAPFR